MHSKHMPETFENISTWMNEHLYESNELLTLKFESVEEKNMQS